jgi:hypothetical protein
VGTLWVWADLRHVQLVWWRPVRDVLAALIGGGWRALFREVSPRPCRPRTSAFAGGLGLPFPTRGIAAAPKRSTASVCRGPDGRPRRGPRQPPL